MNATHETALIDRATTVLKQLGLKVTALKERRRARGRKIDARLRIAKGREAETYVAEAKRAVTPTTLGAVVAHLHEIGKAEAAPTLLVADYLTPPVAEKLRAQGQQFVDAAGNAYLYGPGLFVYVTGRKPRTQRTPAGREFTPNGVKVLFALFCWPELADAPQRAIAAAAGVALGAVPGVLGDLQRAGHLLATGEKRRLNATRRLLDEWALAYARRLRPKTLDATYTTPNLDTWRQWKIDPREVRWGGEPAANLMVGHLKPGVLTLYADKLPAKVIIAQRMAAAERRAPDGPTVELRHPFWGKTLAMPEEPVTPAPLVYADLLATGDARCIETAEMLYDAKLTRPFPAA